MTELLRIRGASVLLGDGFERRDLLIRDGRIGGILSPDAPDRSGKVRELDATGTSMVPGFIDIHTHGAAGFDFNRCSAEEFRRVCAFFASQGVTAFLATVAADTPEALRRRLELLSQPGLQESCPQLLGIHLEGPFLNPEYRGAMMEEQLRPCSAELFDELQAAARGTIRLTTLSPEAAGARELVAHLVARGVKVSLGHSGASYEEAAAAIEAGATGITHIMNAMKPLHMHDPGILCAALESDAYAEMICDGFHLHPPIIRLLLKTKGRNRMIAVSDSMMAAGLPDGNYALCGQEVVVAGGDARQRATGTRAGSTVTMLRTVENLKRFTGLGLERIIPLVTENPARMLGIFDETGSIAEGKRADLVLLDGDGGVAATMVAGKAAYRSEGGQGGAHER